MKHFQNMVFVMLLGILMLAMTAMIAFGHEWYPAECCGGMHCRPVPCDELVEKKDGVHWRDLVFSGKSVRPSQDGSCHVCEETTRYGHAGYCVFVQPSS